MRSLSPRGGGDLSSGQNFAFGDENDEFAMYQKRIQQFKDKLAKKDDEIQQLKKEKEELNEKAEQDLKNVNI